MSNNKNVRIASLFNSATGVAAAVGATFESNLSDNERVLAFNIYASSSQQMQGEHVGAVNPEHRSCTYWTSTATSFMHGANGAFMQGKILVAAHFWSPTKKQYQHPVAYSKNAQGGYSIDRKAEPNGLSAEMWGVYIAELAEDQETLTAKYNQLDAQWQASSDDQESASIAKEMELIASELESIQHKMEDTGAFYGLCENTEVKVNIPELSKDEMKRVWSCLNRKEAHLLKLKCTINYNFSDTFEIIIQVLSYSIEEGKLASAGKGRQVGNALGADLQEAAKELWAEKQLSTAEIIKRSQAKRAAFQATVSGNTKKKGIPTIPGTGSIANRRRQEQKTKHEEPIEAETQHKIAEVDDLYSVSFEEDETM